MPGMIALILVSSLALVYTSAELIDGTKVVGGPALTPQVAFVCGKPAMYLTQSGWQRDDEQECVKSNLEILDYCKERYANLDIVSIVPSLSDVTFTSWCNLGETDTCGNVSRSSFGANSESDEVNDAEFYGMNQTELERIRRTTVFTVRPYRCLVGPFQPDALLIPERCKFAHIDTFDSDNCSTYDSWNVTVAQQCAETSMALYSLAMLLPCDEPAKFAGVEYVCCPRAPLSAPIGQNAAANGGFNADDTAENNEVNDEAMDDDEDEHEADSEEDCFGEVDYYRLYVSDPAALGRSEHQRYEKARRCVIEYYTARKAALVRDLMDARFNSTDTASRLQVDQSFRKLYGETDTMWMRVRRDMNELHQRRVQEEMRILSDAAYDELDAEIDDAADNDPHTDVVQITRIVTAMKTFIGRLVKEELHWIGRYEFLEEHHPERLASTRETIKNFLWEIHSRLNRTFALLNRVPEFEKPVRERIAKFLAENSDVDNEVKMLFPEGLVPAAVRETLARSTTPIVPTKSALRTAKPVGASALLSQAAEPTEYGSEDNDNDNEQDDDYDSDNKSFNLDAFINSPDRTIFDSLESGAVPNSAVRSVDETTTEANREQVKDYNLAEADADDSEDSIESAEPSTFGSPAGGVRIVDQIDTVGHEGGHWSLVIALGALLIVGLAVAGALVGVLIRRKVNIQDSLRVRTETNVVDDSRRLLDAETERGVLGNMQANGYENPTYLLYDKSAHC